MICYFCRSLSIQTSSHIFSRLFHFYYATHPRENQIFVQVEGRIPDSNCIFSSIKKEKKEGHLEKEKPRLESLFSDDFIETCLFDISHSENNAPRPPTQNSPKPLTTARFQKFEKSKNVEKYGSPLRHKTGKTPLRNISILSNKPPTRRPTCLR